MAKAYWIVRVGVTDAARYPEYLAAARPAFEAYGARFIVRGGAFEPMEGSHRERNVVVEFADMETARACYRSPEYQRARALRQAAADADFIIVEGVAASARPSFSGESGRPRRPGALPRRPRGGSRICPNR